MSRFRFSARTWLVVILGLGAAAVMLLLILLNVGGDYGRLLVSDGAETLVAVLVAVFIIRAAYALPQGTLRREWLLVGLSAAAFAVGEVVWSYIELIMHAEVPFPGLADVFYVLQYPLLAAGLIVAILSYRKLVDIRRPVVLAAVLGVVLAAALYLGFLSPYVISQGLATGELALSLFYPLGDVLLLLVPAVAVALIVAQMGAGRLAWPWIALIVGVAFIAVSDTTFSYLQAANNYNGGVIDLGWTLGQVFMAIGASIAWDLAQPSSWR